MRYSVRLNANGEIVSLTQVPRGAQIPRGQVEIGESEVGKVRAEMTRLGRPRWRLDKRTGRALPV